MILRFSQRDMEVPALTAPVITARHGGSCDHSPCDQSTCCLDEEGGRCRLTPLIRQAHGASPKTILLPW